MWNRTIENALLAMTASLGALRACLDFGNMEGAKLCLAATNLNMVDVRELTSKEGPAIRGEAFIIAEALNAFGVQFESGVLDDYKERLDEIEIDLTDLRDSLIAT